MSTADLFINLMPLGENSEFGGIKMIPIHVMNGKLVSPVADLKIKVGQLTYKMWIALKLWNISLGGFLVQVNGTQLDMLLASGAFLMRTLDTMKEDLKTYPKSHDQIPANNKIKNLDKKIFPLFYLSFKYVQ